MHLFADHTTDLLQGWGTVVGAFFAGLAVLGTGLLLWHEMKARREDRQDTQAGQARLIFVGIDSSAQPSRVRTAGPAGPSPWGLMSIKYQIRNYSNGPIFAVRGSLRRLDVEDEGRSIEQVDIGPGQELRGEWIFGTPLAVSGETGTPALGYIQSRIEFMDSAGLIWVRQDREPPRRFLGPADPGWISAWRVLVRMWRDERAGRFEKGATARQWKASRKYALKLWRPWRTRQSFFEK